MQNFCCKNVRCAYCVDGKCTVAPIMDGDGRCSEFKKGLLYYILLVFDTMDRAGNCLPMNLVYADRDIRYGILYICELFGLSYTIMRCGTGGFLVFHKKGDLSTLSSLGISAHRVNESVLRQMLLDLKHDVFPKDMDLMQLCKIVC